MSCFTAVCVPSPACPQENAALPVGTPEYIAPEVLTSLNATPQQGTAGCYGVCCDWWSLGIIGYELLAGVTPFEGDSTAATYGNIMSFNNHLQFPEDVGFSDYFRDLLCRLLSPQNARIQFEEIKKHAFFNGLPWNHLFASMYVCACIMYLYPGVWANYGRVSGEVC